MFEMKEYLGVKRIKATPMSKQKFNTYTGYDSVIGDDKKEGYLVEYMDSPKSNHQNHEGYISWSPKDVFEDSYREIDGLSFGLAIEALKLGKKVARKGWNGDLFIFKQIPANIGTYIIPKMQSFPQSVKDTMIDRDQNLNYRNQCVIVDQQGNVDNWSPSISDCFAEDWMIVE